MNIFDFIRSYFKLIILFFVISVILSIIRFVL